MLTARVSVNAIMLYFIPFCAGLRLLREAFFRRCFGQLFEGGQQVEEAGQTQHEEDGDKGKN